MIRLPNASSTSRLLTLAALVAGVVGLYVGREVFIPLALAMLVSFLLAPLVRRLERIGLWRVPAVLLLTGLALLVVVGVGYILAGQMVQLADRLPEYRQVIRDRVVSVQPTAGSAFGRARRNIQEISQDLATQAASQPAAPVTEPLVEATPVRVVAEPSSSLQLAQLALGSLIHPLIIAGLVLVFVIFILVQREDVRDRLIRLAGEDRVDITTAVFDDAAQRISGYLLMQATINTSFGILMAAGLYLIGLPNALLWGFLAGVLRFIPYIGVWIGLLLPILLSLAVWPHGWGGPLAVVGLLIVLEAVTANVVEPLLYGSGAGISPLAVLVSAVFWGWLWGPVGLLLSTPLTVCMVVMGKYVPGLGFLSVLLGDEPVLAPPVRFYQRLLAEDLEEAQDLAETMLETHSLLKVYDTLLVPALHLAEIDRHRDRLEADRSRVIVEGIQRTIDRLIARDRELAKRPGSTQERPEVPVRPAGSDRPPIQVLCLPASDQADQMVGMMLAQVLTDRGVASRAVPASMLVSEMLDAVEGSGARIVCISAMPPDAMARARLLCKRLETKMPSVKVVIGLWNAVGDIARARDRLIGAGADHVATDLTGVVEILQPSLSLRVARPDAS